MTQFRGIDPINEDSWLVTKVKRNPEAFLVLAAGCALLLRAGGSASRGTGDHPNGRSGTTKTAGMPCANGRPPRQAMLRRKSRIASKRPRARSPKRLQTTRRRCLTMPARYPIGRRATSPPCRTRRATGGAASPMGRHGSSARARSSMQDGAGPDGQGTTVCGCRPGRSPRARQSRPFSRRRERSGTRCGLSVMLPQRRWARAWNRSKAAASATGEQLKDAAQQRGLSAEGIKDMAREATQTFTDKLGGNGARESQATPPSAGGTM